MTKMKKVILFVLFCWLLIFTVSTLYSVTKIVDKSYLDGVEIVGTGKEHGCVRNEDGSWTAFTPDGREVTGTHIYGERTIDCGVGNSIRQESYYDADKSRSVTPGDISLGVIYYTDGDTSRKVMLLGVDKEYGPNGFIKPDCIGCDHKGNDFLSPFTHFFWGPHLIRIIDEDESSISYWFDRGPGEHRKAELKKEEYGSPLSTTTGTFIIEGITPPDSQVFNFIKVGTCPVWSRLDEYGNFKIEFYDIPPPEYNFRLEVIDFANGIIMPDPTATAAQLPPGFPAPGELTGIAIKTRMPEAWVKGKIIDQHANPIVAPICLILREKNAGERFPTTGETVFIGDYQFGTLVGEYEIFVGLLHGGYGPTFYMYPEPNIGTMRYPLESFFDDRNPVFYQSNYQLKVAEGETLNQDIVCYEPDNYVYAKLVGIPEEIQYKAIGIEASGGGYYSHAIVNTKTNVARIAVSSEVSEKFVIRVAYFPFYEKYDFELPKSVVSIGDTATIKIFHR